VVDLHRCTCGHISVISLRQILSTAVIGGIFRSPQSPKTKLDSEDRAGEVWNIECGVTSKGREGSGRSWATLGYTPVRKVEKQARVYLFPKKNGSYRIWKGVKIKIHIK
jgi:hypothetical protein